MEWSEPDDGAWEDPFDPHSEESEAAREPEYPSAPLPAHERRWRHPSELGHAEWVQSERTIGVGRGLMITSGAIGCILGLAVVWLMVPGPGGPPSAGPSVARSDLVVATTAGFGAVATTLAASAGVTTSAPGRPTSTPAVAPQTSTSVASSVAAPVPAITPQLPAEDLPTNTMWVKSDADGAEAAVAVLVGDSPYMVTTAMAIGEVATVRVMRASGGVGEVPVVAVGAGFAYLQTDVSLLRSGFASSALAAQGDTLTVLADEQVTFRLGDDTLARLDPASVAEGTPVVNEAGSLVGLCTRGNGVVELLAIEPPPAAPDDADPQRPSQPSQPQPTVTQPSVTTASSAASTTVTIATSSPASAASSTPTTTSTSPAASSTTSSIATTVGATTTVAVTPGTPTTVAVARGTPWIGVRLAGAGGAIPLAITSITAGSPAAAAGLVVGDVLRAVDGVTVTSVDDVLRRVGSRAPGDTIVVTVDGGAAGREVRVVLGEQTL